MLLEQFEVVKSSIKKRNRQKALRKSIEQWKQIVQKEGQDIVVRLSSRGCACCDLCRDKDDGIDCTCCPVMQYTGRKSCYGTPYYKVRRRLLPAKEMYDWLVKLEKGENPEIDDRRSNELR